jgi:hypothetical protein
VKQTSMQIGKKLSDKTLYGIGKVVANFQQLEWTIVSLIWLLSDDEAEAQTNTAKQKFSWLCNKLKSAFSSKKVPQPLVEKFDDLMSEMSNVNEIRDRVVHSWWFKDPSGEESRMKFVNWKSPQLDLANIDYEGSANRISNLSGQLERLIDELESARVIRRIKIRNNEEKI